MSWSTPGALQELHHAPGQCRRKYTSGLRDIQAEAASVDLRVVPSDLDNLFDVLRGIARRAKTLRVPTEPFVNVFDVDLPDTVAFHIDEGEDLPTLATLRLVGFRFPYLNASDETQERAISVILDHYRISNRYALSSDNGRLLRKLACVSVLGVVALLDASTVCLKGVPACRVLVEFVGRIRRANQHNPGTTVLEELRRAG